MSRIFQTVGMATLATLLASCGGGGEQPAASEETTAAAPAAPAADTPAAPAAPAAAAPTPDSTDTLDGTKLADFTPDAEKGKVVFLQCKTCHVLDPGVNRIGPSLAGLVGRAAGTVEGFSYTPANKNSGITWTPEKLFQYLEKPQRVIPGTKMAFAGLPKAQDRADVIAYIQSGGQ
jgi:cytochrome c